MNTTSATLFHIHPGVNKNEPSNLINTSLKRKSKPHSLSSGLNNIPTRLLHTPLKSPQGCCSSQPTDEGSAQHDIPPLEINAPPAQSSCLSDSTAVITKSYSDADSSQEYEKISNFAEVEEKLNAAQQDLQNLNFAYFAQSEILEKLKDRSTQYEGICFGCSVEWLRSASTNPSDSAAERLDNLAKNKNIFNIQESLSKSELEHPFSRRQRFNTATKSFNALFGKYKTIYAADPPSLNHISENITKHINQTGTPYLIHVKTTTQDHAVAIIKQDSNSFKIFDPNSIEVEVSNQQITKALRNIMMAHEARMTLRNKMLSAEKRLLPDEKIEQVSILPVEFSN